MDIIKHLQGRVDEAKQELERARAKLAEVQTREAQAVKELNVFQGALEAEQRRNGSIQAEPPKPRVTAGSSDDEEGNKTDAVRMLFKNASRGVKPRDLMKLLTDAGISANPNYTYGVVARLKRSGEIEKRNGRYHATSKLLEVQK
ncbi:MAG: hypothetical protein ACHP7I_02155 [Terriglobales bacterium]